ERIGVSRQTIISIEKGKYNPSLPLAMIMAEVFQVQVEDIFELEASDYKEGGYDDGVKKDLFDFRCCICAIWYLLFVYRFDGKRISAVASICYICAGDHVFLYELFISASEK